jgi:hypothetical protein
MLRRAGLVLCALGLLGLALPVRAAGTVTLAHRTIGNIRTVTATITADAADATIPATALPAIEGRLLALVTNPGTTAPTDNYDVTLVDQHGHDVLEGVGANRDTANTEKVSIVFSATAVHPAVDDGDTLTLTIVNNAVNSAEIVLVLYYALGG